MNTSNLRDYLFKDRPGEEFGQRAEAIITMLLGFLTTVPAIFAYRSPIVIVVSAITNAVAIFVLIQAIRGRYNYLIIFPIVRAISICLISIVEGSGTHDLIWMGGIGLFLLANIYTRKNSWHAIWFGFFMVFLFVGTGLAEINNLIANPYATDLEYILLNSFFLTMIMGVVVVVFQRHYKLLEIATENKNELDGANQRLGQINLTLEDQIQLRTDELNSISEQMQEKTKRLQAASEISQDLMANINEKSSDLLARAARNISEKFGFYHTGIFLLDENREYAILRAANSKGGQKMLARHHQLKVGGVGIVGYVAQGGRPRIALNTGADAVFFNNPDMPETRSEMALPLKIGSQVIGVIDIQSTQPSAFNEEDISILSTLANQVAVVIQNSQVKHDIGVTTFDIKQTVRLNRKQPIDGFSYLPDGTISTAMTISNPTFDKAIASSETVILERASGSTPPSLAVPVKIRDTVIGVIHIESAQNNRKWTDDEVALVQSISERAALALENAQLFEEAEKSAEREHVIAQVTSRISESTNMEHILHTTIRELGRTLGATRAFIQLDAKPSEENNTQLNTEDGNSQ